MRTAAKVRRAFESALGPGDHAERFHGLRIGLWSGDESREAAGVLMAEALGDILGRLGGQIEASGALSKTVIDSANAAAESGGGSAIASEGWRPPYDFTISMGCAPPDPGSPHIRIGADGWVVTAGSEARLGEDPNPVGPCVAAVLASAEAFKQLFRDALGDAIRPLPSPYEWNVWSIGGPGPAPAAAPLLIHDGIVIGVGAVSHGLCWIAERWPAEIRGTLSFVDCDDYDDDSNPQRYVGMRLTDIGKNKAMQMAAKLAAKHGDLNVRGFDVDMNSYFARERQDAVASLIIVGVDSVEHRKQLAVKLPKRVVNMWTDGEWAGAARHGFADPWPCLYCRYPDRRDVVDETSEIVTHTGLGPSRVRALLDSSAAIDDPEAQAISSRLQIPLEAVLGRPLRSVMGAVCAVLRVPVIHSVESVDVPLPFVSFLSGIAGFVLLMRELSGDIGVPGGWRHRAFAYPTELTWASQEPRADCFLCDPQTRELVRRKYD